MMITRYFEVAVLAALASIGMGVIVLLLGPNMSHSVAGPERARFVMLKDDGPPHAYQAQLLAMRALHQRALTAATPEIREALASESGPVMRAGVTLMLRMKADLPASVAATGEVVSGLSVLEAQSVHDFLQLVELLIEMKSDLDGAVGPGAHRTRDTDSVDSPSTPEPRSDPDSLLVISGARARHCGHMA